MRTAIRHIATIPVEIYTGRKRHQTQGSLCDISLGGLSFVFSLPLKKGMRVRVKIALVRPIFEGTAKVVWCTGQNSSYRVGIQFVNIKDTLRMRIVDQLCQIENYKDEVLQRQGRTLTSEEAAREWLGRLA